MQRVSLVAVAVFVACKPVAPPAAGVPAAASPPVLERAGSAVGAAAFPDVAALVQAVEIAARKAGLHPAERGPPPLLADLPEGPVRVARLADVPQRGPPGPVEVFETPWRRVPWARVEGDRLVVRWATREPAPGGTLYAGVHAGDDPLGLPRDRPVRREDLASPATEHVASVALAPLFAAVGAKGPGEVTWRVETWDPQASRTAAWEGRVAVGRDGARFVQRPTVVLGPRVDRLTEKSVVISFDTDERTLGAVARTGQAPVLAGGPSTHHEFSLEGLEPGHTYLYRVAASDGAETTTTPVAAFRTRRLGAPVVVAILADSASGGAPGSYAGIDAPALRDLVVRAARDGAEALFFLGDRADGPVTRGDVYDLRLAAWQHVVDPVHRSLPIYTGLGSRDALLDVTGGPLLALDKPGDASAEAHFARAVANPPGAPPPESKDAPPYDEAAYSWDIGPVHFVMLDTDYWWSAPPGDPRLQGRGNRPGLLMAGQLAWLESDLAKARRDGAAHIVVMGGEPAFPVAGAKGMWWGGGVSEVNAARTRFWTLLARYHVLAYVSGGEAAYSRALIGPETVPGAATAVWSIVTGGAAGLPATRRAPAAYAGRVRAFSDRQHLTEWTFDAAGATLRVVDRQGGLVEEVDLGGS